MRKRKQPPRERTQYQLDQAEYSAYRFQAWHRQYMAGIGVTIPYTDPTLPYLDEDQE